MRTRSKVDANQKAITEGLRKFGVSVQPIHQLGKGVPDLLCGFRGANFILECKDGTLSPSRRKLTPDEEQWHSKWAGSVHIVESLDEALIVLGVSFKKVNP
jgi:hypothetical protein